MCCCVSCVVCGLLIVFVAVDLFVYFVYRDLLFVVRRVPFVVYCLILIGVVCYGMWLVICCCVVFVAVRCSLLCVVC